MRTLVYIGIFLLAIIALYLMYQKVLFAGAPWKKYPGDEPCRQQNNDWLSQAIAKKDKRLCQKTAACVSDNLQTNEFDEIDRCQTEYDKAADQ